MKTGPRHKPGAYEESDTNDVACQGVPTSTPAEQPVIFSGTTTLRESEAGPLKKRTAPAMVQLSKKRKTAPQEQEAEPSKKKRAPMKSRAGKTSVKAQLPPSKERIGTDTDDTGNE